MKTKIDKKFIRSLGLLSIPIVLQDFLNSMVNFVDSWMVGQIGLNAINGVGLSNRLSFLFLLLMFGVNSGSAVFMGQYWGKKEISGIHKVMGICMVCNLALASIFAGIALFLPNWFLGILTPNEYVIEVGVSYLRILSISYFLTAITFSLNATLRSIRQTKVPMVTTMFALVAKLSLNYIFIFVLDLGVVGAAWGTVFARVVEIIVALVIIKKLQLPIIAPFKNYLSFLNVGFLKKYFKLTMPVILNEGIWALGIFLYDVAYRFSGHEAQGSVQVNTSILQLFSVFAIGVGAGSAIMISNLLGANEEQAAKDMARKCLQVGFVVIVVMALLMVVISPFILMTYNVDDAVRQMIQRSLYVSAIAFLPKILNYYLIVSILRSGGDTMFCLVVDSLSVWLIGVPMAFLGAYFLGLPIYFVLGLVYLEEVVKFFIAFARYKKGAWARRVV